MYCRFGNFPENFIFANSIKRHISDVKNSRLRKDLPISVNDRVIKPFQEGFIFMKLCENEVLAKISKFKVYVQACLGATKAQRRLSIYADLSESLLMTY